MQFNLQQAQAVGLALVNVIGHIFSPCVLKPDDTFVPCSAYRMVPVFNGTHGDDRTSYHL